MNYFNSLFHYEQKITVYFSQKKRGYYAEEDKKGTIILRISTAFTTSRPTDSHHDCVLSLHAAQDTQPTLGDTRLT